MATIKLTARQGDLILRIAKTWDSLGHYFRAIQWARLLVEMRYVAHATLIVGIAGE